MKKREKNHIVSSDKPSKRIMFGIPMTGLLRSEWHLAYISQVIPCNWSQALCIHPVSQYSPIQFAVADARNIIADKCVKEGFDWLFFIDHDVVMPHNTVLKWNERMLKGNVPIFGGLYFTKSFPAEPLVYRGRGNSFYNKWKMGDEVWVDGMGLGCHMIHGSILKVLWEESEAYQVHPGLTVKRIFESPANVWYDPERGVVASAGTEDLPWYERIMKENVFKKAGWPKLQRRKYPFLCDTSIFCKHIDWNGTQYPANEEEKAFGNGLS